MSDKEPTTSERLDDLEADNRVNIILLGVAIALAGMAWYLAVKASNDAKYGHEHHELKMLLREQEREEFFQLGKKHPDASTAQQAYHKEVTGQ